jgi:signal transduction histidine kinase
VHGFDEDWVEAGTQRLASYSRLPAGSYRFEVIGCNHAGIWNEAGATFRFAVLPFFWQTLSFRVTIIALFTLGVVAIVRYVSFRRLHLRMLHLEHQAALHRERARIAKDIHDDLGANLTQIALLGELADQDRDAPARAGERIRQISGTARQAIKSLDEIVWAVNPRNDTLAHLIDYAGQFALDYLRVAGIRCRLDFPATPPSREISTDVRHNLFLVIKEALHNTVKHARATEVWLRVHAGSDGLHISIEDNGRGFSETHTANGADGLHNMRQRVDEIGGVCTIESRQGAGTTLKIKLPWSRKPAHHNN